MRYYQIISESSPSPENEQLAQGNYNKWWFNALTGVAQRVPSDSTHYETVTRNPQAFEVSRAEVQKIVDDVATSADPFADEAAGDRIVYEAMKKGWVRIGGQDNGDLLEGYVYAANVRFAQIALRWMMKEGLAVDDVIIEIFSPSRPTPGNGETFLMLNDERKLKRFIRYGDRVSF